ncbi:MAG TPA: phosphoribosyltransferase [Polyangiales bacterium]
MRTNVEVQPRPRFQDRRHAGSALAGELSVYAGRDDLVVLGLPRGGVPVAFEVAVALGAPLDVFVVRKLGFPGHEEFAMGAIASGGVRVLNPELRDELATRGAMVDTVAARELTELERRESLYRHGRQPIPLKGRCVIIIDDGLATGSSMLAAVTALQRHRPGRIVVGVPVGSRDACSRLGREVDDIVCATTPEPFSAVGRWYERFDQTSDEEVTELLELALLAWSRHSNFPPEPN